MNILYIIHQFYPEFGSGTEKFLLNLSSALQQDGHAARIVSYGLTPGDRGSTRNGNLLVREYAYNNLPVTAVKHKTAPSDINSAWADPDVYDFAVKFLRGKNRCDLVHIAHGMRMASFAKAAMDLGIPYILTLTDFWMICPKIVLRTSSNALCTGPEGGEACSKMCPELVPFLVKSRLAFAKQILAGAKAVVAPSQFVAAIFRKEIPELNMQVIPHGMDLRHLKPNSRRYKQGDKIVLGYCGGMVPHKGVHLLLKAFRSLEQKNAELRLYGDVAREKDYSYSLEEIAGQDERIKFCGTYKAEEVGDVFQGIDVLVIPSLCYESYSLTLHEALGCNVPVIAANIGALPEKVVDSVTGFTFQAGNENELRNKIEAILANPALLNGIKDTIREQVPALVEEEAYLYARLYRAVALSS